MPRLITALTFLCLVVPSLSYDRRSAEEELRYLSQNAQTYLTEVLIWVAVVSVLIFAMILCICDLAIRLCFKTCRRQKDDEKADDVVRRLSYSSRISLSGEGYYTNVPLPSSSRSIIV